MHILLVHQAFVALGEAGGTRHHELARFLVQRGHRVTIIASPISYLTGKTGSAPHTEDDMNGQLTILRTYTYSALHRSFVHRVFSFLSFMASSFLAGLRVRHVDLVWGTSPPIFQGATAWLLARLKGVPFLFEVRDLWPIFAIQVGVLRNPLIIRMSEWLERFLYRHADCLMVNSPGFIQHVASRGAKRVELVPNGADPGMFDPQDQGTEFRQAHNLQDKFVALYAGAHGLSNDLGIVLQAAKIIQEQPVSTQDIAIVLLGDGKEKPALIAQATEMGLNNVHFISPVPKSEMSQALAAADACIGILKPVPMYATVYPNKIFDYMAAGRPTVLAMEGVIREVVEQADGGLPVPPGDPPALAAAICHLAENPPASRQMGLNARRYLETHFDRLEMAHRLAQLVETLQKQP